MIKNILATAALVAASAALAGASTVTFYSGNTGFDATLDFSSGITSTEGLSTTVSTGSDDATLAVTAASGKLWGASVSTDTWTNDTAISALAEYDISIDGISGGVQVGAGGVATYLTFTELTAGETYTIALVVAELAGTASTFSVSAGTLVSGTAYDLTSDDDGTTLGDSVTTYTVAANNAGTAIIVDVTADDDGTIQFTYSSKGTVIAAYITVAATTDVPEPSAFGLLAGVGALVLVAARRRRSRKA